MKVFIAGASGLIGLPLTKALLARGHQVTGLARDPGGLEKLAQLGAQVVGCDVYDRPRLLEAMLNAAPEVVIHQLSALPARLRLSQIEQDSAETNRLRSLGTFALLEAARQAGAHRFIAQSSAAIYSPDKTGKPASENESFYANAPGGFDKVVKAISDMEWQVLNNGLAEGVTLRYGHIYGPGTAYDRGGFLNKDVCRGRMPLSGTGQGMFSFVHLVDAVNATLLAVETSPSGAYNICDDHPVSYAEWLPWYAALLKARKPPHLPLFLVRWIAGEYGVTLIERQRGASNLRAKALLGWKLIYPHWRDGFTRLLTTP